MLDFVQKIVAKMTKRRKKVSSRVSRWKTAAWPENYRRRRRRAALGEGEPSEPAAAIRSLWNNPEE